MIAQTRALLALLALLGALMLPGVAAAQGQEPLRVPAGQRVDGNVASVTQSIVVEGEVTGDVTSWGGDITVRGRVGGDVVSYAGRVIIAPTAQIGGSVLAAGGQVERSAQAQVAGQMLGGLGNGKAVASVVSLFVPSPATQAPNSGVANVFFGLLSALFLAAFSLLWAALWPRRTAAATATLRALPLRALGMGLLSTLVLAALLLPLAALLSATIVGLPVLVLVLLLLQLPYIFGFATLIQAFGTNDPLHGSNIGGRSVLAALALVALVGIVGALWPLGGVALFYLLASPGLGAAVLSRGGVLLPRTLA